jgi:hypothetical protein
MSIRAHDHRNARQRTREHLRLIARALDRLDHTFGRADDDRAVLVNAAAVSAAEDRGRSPLSSNIRAIVATTGVLPLPPTTRLPTLMTGRVSDRARVGIRSYHARRSCATRP